MQTGSETSSERVDVSEVSSEPKSNGPLENEGKLNDDVQEPNKTDMIKVKDDSKVKSEVESGVEPKSASDVIVDVSHEEGSDETDDKGKFICILYITTARMFVHLISWFSIQFLWFLFVELI